MEKNVKNVGNSMKAELAKRNLQVASPRTGVDTDSYRTPEERNRALTEGCVICIPEAIIVPQNVRGTDRGTVPCYVKSSVNGTDWSFTQIFPGSTFGQSIQPFDEDGNRMPASEGTCGGEVCKAFRESTGRFLSDRIQNIIDTCGHYYKVTKAWNHMGPGMDGPRKYYFYNIEKLSDAEMAAWTASEQFAPEVADEATDKATKA